MSVWMHKYEREGRNIIYSYTSTRNSVTEWHFKKKNYADDQWKKEIPDNAV